MKFERTSAGNYGVPLRLELTRRNLETLLAKLDDPESRKTILDPASQITVVAVENEEHYADRAPGVMLVQGRLV